MLIKNWMSTDVITLTPDRSMMKASKLMKDNNISRIPVVDEQGKLLGLVSDRDIKEASPSKATTLDMHELYYLVSEIKLKDIMTKDPVTVRQDETVEKAAVLMLEGNFGSLPVVDDDDRVAGIITDSDVFKVMISITGVTEGGVQIGFRLSNAPGGLVPVQDYLKANNARVMSILTMCEPPEVGTRNVFIRIREMDKPSLKKLLQGLEENFEVLYWVQDPVHPIC